MYWLPAIVLTFLQADPFGRGAGPGGAEVAVITGILIFFGVIAVGAFAIQIVVNFLLYSCFQRIPPQFRLMEPWQVWLLLIPCFYIIWNFFVYLRLAQSYKRYFNSIGRHDVGDCGEGIGLAYAICVCVAHLPVPYLGCVVAIACLTLWIIYVVKAMTLRSMIPEGAAAMGGFGGYPQGFPPPGPNYPPKGF